MNVTGIIAEYNPFHNGHAYHIREARRLSGCDYLIAAISGDFVQRGAPAILDKYTRAEAALLAGADLVIELPLMSASASAELFAEGGIRLFQDLRLVNSISFGTEVPIGSSLSETFLLMQQCAEFLAEEPPAYSLLLRSHLASGLSFAAARAQALNTLHPEFSAILKTPNSILGIEYIKQLFRRNAAITPIPVARTGADYHDLSAGTLCSASALRSQLFSGSKRPYSHEMDLQSVPQKTHALYRRSQVCLQADDFSDLLFSKLQPLSPDEIAAHFDIRRDAANRIYRESRSPFTFTELGDRLMNRSLTRTYIDRALCHLLLSLKQSDADSYRSLPVLPYAHVLGLKRDALPLLSALSEAAAVPLLVRLATDAGKLSKTAAALYQTEASADLLYTQVQYRHSGKAQLETTRRLLLL